MTLSQSAEHHVRREEILKRKGLVSTGGQGGDRKSSDKLSLGLSYAAQTAETLGVNKRTVERDLARGKKIDARAFSSLIESSGVFKSARF